MNNLDTKRTTIHLDIRYVEDGQYYHLLNYEAYPEDINEEDSKLPAYPTRLSFSIDRSLNTNDEIAEAVVDYLATLKLYLHSYSITQNCTYVSYELKTPAFREDLTYSPAHQSLELYIDANVQKEDGVDYEKELNIKLHSPIDAISLEEIEDFGLTLKESGVEIPTILREDELPEDY